MLSSTEVRLAERLEFARDNFNDLYRDLPRFLIARAVAASSLVPALLTSITVRNYVSALDHYEAITSSARSAHAW